MIRNAMIYSIIVLTIASVALLVICYFGQILELRHWIAGIAIVVVALALVACRWWVVVKQKKKRGVPEQDCTDLDRLYPDPDWKCITGFWFKTDLCLARLKERDPRLGPEQQYIVAKDYVVCVALDGGGVLTIKVPRGTVTDLASVPRAFRWYVGRVGPHLEASIVHDWLYVAWQVHKLTPTDNMRLFSDKVILTGMLASGMHCKAYAIYWAIRVFGTCTFYGRNPEPRILEEPKMPECRCLQSAEASRKC